MTVASSQRFSRQHPCPVCSGCDSDPRGKGKRCHGFLSGDREWAHCTRPEHAGGLPMKEGPDTYAHRLAGDCRCGQRHAPRPPDPLPGPNGTGRRIVAEYDYQDEASKPIFQTVRYEPKDFKQRRPDGKGDWIWNLKGVELVLYRLPDLIAADPAKPVFVTEGEEHADRLRELGSVATTSPMGAGKWRDGYARWLKGRHVIILPDNDDPGHSHAAKVARSLHRVAKSVRVLELPGLEYKGDVLNWLALGHTAEELMDLAREAPEWEPGADQGRSSGGEDEANGSPAKLQLTYVNTVEPKTVAWLWNRRVPMGKLTIIGGDPGLGKSYLTLDLTARVSLGGPWPDDGSAPQGAVLLLSAEDGVEDTIRPRLDLLGADLSRVIWVGMTLREEDKEVSLSLAEHLAQLEAAIIEHGAVLLVLDPILAFTGKGSDTHKSSDVRAVLAPLAAMADRTGCAIVSVLHLNKRSSEGNSIYRLMASLDFTAAARSVLLVGKHPDDPNRRVLASVKSNLSAPSASLGFHFTEDGCFAWDGVVDLDADAILAASSPEERTKRDEAWDFLRDVLSDGPVLSTDVFREAREYGIAEKTLRRAAKDHSVDIAHVGERGKRGGGNWFWRLPPKQDGQDTPRENSGHLDKSGHLDSGEEISKMATLGDSVDTNPIKMATPSTQGELTTSITPDAADGQQGGHLDGDDDWQQGTV